MGITGMWAEHRFPCRAWTRHGQSSWQTVEEDGSTRTWPLTKGRNNSLQVSTPAFHHLQSLYSQKVSTSS